MNQIVQRAQNLFEGLQLQQAPVAEVRVPGPALAKLYEHLGEHGMLGVLTPTDKSHTRKQSF
jgi:hypothetical protein